jgi:hypothetical protein
MASTALYLLGQFCCYIKFFSMNLKPLNRIEASMIQEERITVLNRKEIKKGRYVLYWMQASQMA